MNDDNWRHPYEVLTRPGVQFTDEQKAQIRHYVFWTSGKIRYRVYKIALCIIHFLERQ